MPAISASIATHPVVVRRIHCPPAPSSWASKCELRCLVHFALDARANYDLVEPTYRNETKTDVKRIRAKLGLRDRAQAAPPDWPAFAPN